jgi:D-3-phosphoglycerate dehydrogenase
MPYRVLIADAIHEEGVTALQRRSGFIVDVAPDMARPALIEAIADYHAIVIGGRIVVDAELLGCARNLRIIAPASPNLDHIDVREATRLGIVVISAAAAATVARAEHTISLIMAMHRHIPQAVGSMKAGKWEKKKFQGHEMAGRTLGLIGLGRVGGMVSRLASRGLRMQVVAYDAAITREAASELGVTAVSLDELFARSDVVSIHVPLTQDTKDLLNTRAFAKMKAGVMLVNSSPASVIDRQALVDALECGKVAAAALDAFWTSPPAADPLVAHPRVIATPELGDATTEAELNIAASLAGQIVDYLEKGIALDAVNLPSLEPSEIPRMAPYLDLAQRLGRVLGWLAPKDVAHLEIEFRGDVAGWPFKTITNAALAGFLRRFVAADINQVNAAMLAQERGLSVSATTYQDARQPVPSLALRARAREGAGRSVQGSLSLRQRGQARLTGVDQFSTDAVPTGTMLIVTNRDIPGMIAGVSGVLARRGVNIAQMNLARESAGGVALSIYSLDEPVDDATIDSITAIEGVLSAKQVVLDW